MISTTVMMQVSQLPEQEMRDISRFLQKNYTKGFLAERVKPDKSKIDGTLKLKQLLLFRSIRSPGNKDVLVMDMILVAVQVRSFLWSTVKLFVGEDKMQSGAAQILGMVSQRLGNGPLRGVLYQSTMVPTDFERTTGKRQQYYVEKRVKEICKRAKIRNFEHEVTGCLVCDPDGCVFQYIEGPESAVQQLLENIGKDARHADIKVILDVKISKRMCANWTMKLGTSKEYERLLRKITRLRLSAVKQIEH